jgi:hypothetical protein
LNKIDLKRKEMANVDYYGPERVYGMELDENGMLNIQTTNDQE